MNIEPAFAKATAGQAFNQPSLKPRIKFGMQALWRAGCSTFNIERSVAKGLRQGQ